MLARSRIDRGRLHRGPARTCTSQRRTRGRRRCRAGRGSSRGTGGDCFWKCGVLFLDRWLIGHRTSGRRCGRPDPADAGETPKESGAGDAAPAAVDHGKEYLWIDQTFHWATGIDTNVAKTGPHNWFDENGVDYYDGKVEFRVNVTAKADATPVWHELCHWQNALGDNAHVCLHCLALYTKPGEYTCETTAAQQGGPVDYHKPFVAVQNRVKDGTSGRGTDLTTENKGLPIDYHYTVVIVPKGQAFSGWASYPLP